MHNTLQVQDGSGVSVVIPVYRAAESLDELYKRLIDTFDALRTPVEIVFVEDNGGDPSWEIIERLAENDGRIRGIKLSRNYGQHNALLCGIRAASKDIIVTIDDDLQNPPEEIPKLLAKLAEGSDVVYGTPEREQHGFLRDQASRITKLALQSAMGAETARKVSAFRAFRAHIKDAFAGYRSPYVNIDVLLTWGTTNFASVVVKHAPRKTGESGYTLRKLVIHALNMMTGFSTLPLHLASMIGFLFSLFGVGILAYVLIRYFWIGITVPGFAFLASMIAIFSGAQLIALGIIGEYLARMHFRTMDRPPYQELRHTARLPNK